MKAPAEHGDVDSRTVVALRFAWMREQERALAAWRKYREAREKKMYAVAHAWQEQARRHDDECNRIEALRAAREALDNARSSACRGAA